MSPHGSEFGLQPPILLPIVSSTRIESCIPHVVKVFLLNTAFLDVVESAPVNDIAQEGESVPVTDIAQAGR